MDKTTYILAGWLIDGSGGPIQEKVLLQIVDGRFAAIEPYSADSVPSAAQLSIYPTVPSYLHWLTAMCICLCPGRPTIRYESGS